MNTKITILQEDFRLIHESSNKSWNIVKNIELQIFTITMDFWASIINELKKVYT